MEEGISRKRFIRLGAAVGVTTAGASVVAACGGESGGGGGDTATSSGGGETTSAEPSGGATSAQGSGGEVIAQTSAVPQNSVQTFTNEGQPAVLVHLQSGDFVAYSAVCTHQQCTVTYQDGQLACPCHGSLFDPSNGGQVVQGPAEEPLPEIPVQVQNGEVTKA
ncbi:MAG: Rieske (2Fe-2S) protein [Actinomycetota bacterium]|nr:Rieske (2Fe-2S) protein [Actinomycetota bacterium]